MWCEREVLAYPGRFYVLVGGKHIEIRPSMENRKLIWTPLNAIGVGFILSAVQESDIRWTSGDIPEVG